jgi:hypothetical protein
MNERTELSLGIEDHERAFTEVSFLLEMLVRTAGEVVGKSTPSLGTNAGRHMARKLPIYLPQPDLASVMAALARQMEAGFAMSPTCAGAAAQVGFSRCAVRAVCKDRKLEVGGDLCRMFHYYLAGMAAQLMGRPVRVGAVTAGEQCTVRLESQA